MLAIPNEGKVDEANYFFQLIKMQMNGPTVIFNAIKSSRFSNSKCNEHQSAITKVEHDNEEEDEGGGMNKQPLSVSSNP